MSHRRGARPGAVTTLALAVVLFDGGQGKGEEPPEAGASLLRLGLCSS